MLYTFQDYLPRYSLQDSTDAGECITIPCRGVGCTAGDKIGLPCLFPFTYSQDGGKLHNGCIYEDKSKKYWCSTRLNYNGKASEHHYGQWGYCSLSCPKGKNWQRDYLH